MATLYLVRHAPTRLNQPGRERVRGHLAVAPEPVALRHWLAEVAPKLAGNSVTFVASSDLPRGRVSAQALGAKLGVTRILATPELDTWNTGAALEGQNYGEADPVLRRYVENPRDRPEGGEPFAEFLHRWGKALAKLKDHAWRTGQSGVIIAHGNMLMTLPHLQTGAPVAFIPHDRLPRPGSIVAIQIPAEL